MEALVGDLVMAWDRAGDGPAIVLIHAALADRQGWRAQVEALVRAGFAVLTYDRRGHGATRGGWPAAGHTVEQDALDLLGLLAIVGIREAALVGHSYGALVALEAARRARAREREIWALGLREPPLLALLAENPATALLAQEVAGWMEDVLACVRVGAAELALDRFLSRSVAPDWRTVLRPEVLPVLHAHLAALGPTLAALASYRVAPEDLAAVGMPALLVTDERTRPEAAAITGALAGALPRSMAVDLGEGLPLADRARTAAFNAALVRFLTSASGLTPHEG